MIIQNQEYHLGRKAFTLFLSRRSITALVFLCISIVVAISHGSVMKALFGASKAVGGPGASSLMFASDVISYASGLLFMLAVLAFLIGLAVSWLEYRHYAFTFEEFGMKVVTGILNKEEVSIPYRQMQDINIRRNVSYQLLGVSKLIIDSAGHEEKDEQNETDLILEPLDKDTAEDIRVFLQRKIGVQVVVGEHDADKENVAMPHAS